MKIIDLHDPSRVNRNPDDIKALLETGNFIQDEFKISRIELRYYIEKVDENTWNILFDYFFCSN